MSSYTPPTPPRGGMGIPLPRPRPATAEQIVAALVGQLAEHQRELARSVLDGTVSCRTCRALVLESNQDAHASWHASTGTRR